MPACLSRDPMSWPPPPPLPPTPDLAALLLDDGPISGFRPARRIAPMTTPLPRYVPLPRPLATFDAILWREKTRERAEAKAAELEEAGVPCVLREKRLDVDGTPTLFAVYVWRAGEAPPARSLAEVRAAKVEAARAEALNDADGDQGGAPMEEAA